MWDPSLPAGQRRLIADELTTTKLRNLVPGYDMALKGKAYRTCAVVGSSGSLLLQKLGGLIDQHTLVIRSNDAPRLGYADWVGTKTNLRVEGAESWGFHEDGQEVSLVHSTVSSACSSCGWRQLLGPGSVWGAQPGGQAVETGRARRAAGIEPPPLCSINNALS